MQARTTRQTLNRIRKQTALLAAAGFFSYAAGAYLCMGELSKEVYLRGVIDRGAVRVLFYEEGLPLMFAGTITGACAVVGRNFGGRCRHCKQPLNPIFSRWPGSFAVPAALRFCPYCSSSLDAPVDAETNT